MRLLDMVGTDMDTDGPTIHQKQLWRLQPIMNHSSKNNPITGITVQIRKDTTHTLETVRVVG